MKLTNKMCKNEKNSDGDRGIARGCLGNASHEGYSASLYINTSVYA